MSDSANFQPVSGRLGQLIFESPGDGIDPRLEFFFEIEFQEAEIDDETVKPFYRASNIIAPAKSWRDLENTSLEFPWAPKPGSVDANMLLFAEQNPADLVKIQFGAAEGGNLPITFSTEVDFEIEADRDELGQVEIEISQFPLEISPLKIATSIEKRLEGDTDRISKAISGFVELSDYGPVEKVPGGLALKIRK